MQGRRRGSGSPYRRGCSLQGWGHGGACTNLTDWTSGGDMLYRETSVRRPWTQEF